MKQKVHPSPAGGVAVKNTSALNEPDKLQLNYKNIEDARRRKNSLTWKEINSESPRKARSDSSSYSENSDSESSTSTSLCDDENFPSFESTPVKKKRHKEIHIVNEKENLSAKIDSTQADSNSMNASTVVHEMTNDKEQLNLATSENSESSEGISSISQLSPMPDISSYFSTAISPIKSPSNYYDFPDFSAFSIASNLT